MAILVLNGLLVFHVARAALRNHRREGSNDASLNNSRSATNVCADEGQQADHSVQPATTAGEQLAHPPQGPQVPAEQARDVPSYTDPWVAWSSGKPSGFSTVQVTATSSSTMPRVPRANQAVLMAQQPAQAQAQVPVPPFGLTAAALCALGISFKVSEALQWAAGKCGPAAHAMPGSTTHYEAGAMEQPTWTPAVQLWYPAAALSAMGLGLQEVKAAQQGPMPELPTPKHNPAQKPSAASTAVAATHRAEGTWAFRQWENVHKATALRVLLCSRGARVACWVGLLGTVLYSMLYSEPYQTAGAP